MKTLAEITSSLEGQYEHLYGLRTDTLEYRSVREIVSLATLEMIDPETATRLILEISYKGVQ